MKRLFLTISLVLSLVAYSSAMPPSPPSKSYLSDAELAALAGLTSAANAIPYFTGSGTAGTISSSANMVSLLGSADYATARTNLGLAIGSNVQAYDADLTTYAGITPSANVQTMLGSANNAAILSNIGAEPALTDEASLYSTLSDVTQFIEMGETISATDAAGPSFLNEAATSTNPTLVPNKADLDTGIGWTAANQLSLIAGGVEGLRITEAGGLIEINTVGVMTGGIKSAVLTTAEGVHDGANDAAIMTDSGESFTVDAYIGMTLYNVTDGSSTTITDNDGTTMTGVLAGGTDNNWDTNDVWAVAPGPLQSGTIWYISSATTILHPATAGYVACYYSTGANIIKVDPQSGSMQFTLYGTPTGTNGEELDSAGAAGNFIWIHNQSATVGVTLGASGIWADGGSS